MYLWFGIDVDKYYTDIKKRVKEIEKEVSIDLGMVLPYHISLKMSFLIDERIKNDVIDSLTDYFKNILPFDINSIKIEKYNNIIWVRMQNNDTIDNIHIDLNNMLLEKYNISLHEYDLDFLFHTTLFMDNDANKINKAYNMIKDITIPKTVKANKFLIGSSDSGQPGTYKIIKEIEI